MIERNVHSYLEGRWTPRIKERKTSSRIPRKSIQSSKLVKFKKNSLGMSLTWKKEVVSFKFIRSIWMESKSTSQQEGNPLENSYKFKESCLIFKPIVLFFILIFWISLQSLWEFNITPSVVWMQLCKISFWRTLRIPNGTNLFSYFWILFSKEVFAEIFPYFLDFQIRYFLSVIKVFYPIKSPFSILGRTQIFLLIGFHRGLLALKKRTKSIFNLELTFCQTLNFYCLTIGTINFLVLSLFNFFHY